MSESEEELENGHAAGDLDLLSAPLDNGDGLTAALTRRPRAKLPSLTLVLVTVAVASAGFIGGIMVGKHYASSSGSRGGAAAFGQFPGGAALPGGTGSGAPGGTRSGAPGGTGSGAPTGTGSGSGANFGGAGGGGFAGANATVGTIKLIDGQTVYVQTSAGDIVQVSTSAGTKVTVSSAAKVKDLTPGETVIVQGSKNSTGGVSATSISQSSGSAGLGG